MSKKRLAHGFLSLFCLMRDMGAGMALGASEC